MKIRHDSFDIQYVLCNVFREQQYLSLKKFVRRIWWYILKRHFLQLVRTVQVDYTLLLIELKMLSKYRQKTALY